MKSPVLMQPFSRTSSTLVPSGLIQRKCACGEAAGLTDKCSECQKNDLTLQHKQLDSQGSELPPIVYDVLRSPDPGQQNSTPQVRRALNEAVEPPTSDTSALFFEELERYGIGCGLMDDRNRQPLEETALKSAALPAAHSATIVCDGNSGYEVDLGDWPAKAKCGYLDCIVKHEKSHIEDWEKAFPEGCKGKKKGEAPPNMECEPLLESECKAYAVENKCAYTLWDAAKGGCKPILEAHWKKALKDKRCCCELGLCGNPGCKTGVCTVVPKPK